MMLNLHPVSGTTDNGLLHEAFRSFDDAAATLQQSYQTLTSRLDQLDVELADRNEALDRNLRANEDPLDGLARDGYRRGDHTL